jgi:hypothetical protein
MQVQRGEHGIKLAVFVPIVKKDDAGQETVTGRMPWSTTVFCRCQVAPKGD